MKHKAGRYSKYIKPINYAVDLFVINAFALLLPINFFYPHLFLAYISLAWVVISLKTEFYEVQRYAKFTRVLSLIFQQFVFFFLVLYAFIGFFKQPNMSRLTLAEYFALTFVTISLLKIITYILLLRYRAFFKGNIRKVVVLGNNKKTQQLIDVFNSRLEFGYEFKKQFSPLGGDDLLRCFEYVVENDVDEIYCSIAELKDKELSELIDFADNNLKMLKFIPDNKNIFAKKLKFEYYDYIPILSLRDIPLDDTLNAFVKRLFDLAFSFFVILFLLSWLTPLLALIIKIESRGPVFFRQRRHGINSKEFYCYKFRSMAMSEDADKKQATKHDMRITRVGRFIRRTSIDELPQFYNVFLGQMSVVGPRPHMVKHTNLYGQQIDKYMVRHFVKPGITGLAQTRGYRGEIETETDIINRVKFDIFYIENWSLALDLKIMAQTILNAIKGEEKAY
ncbi:undecaprenyl-phosphate glucose phosphotransferase [Sinomicrobium weinanense]|uniref:Undecaprenyl-phosphate glucose phosphotransferase n=1 Tax=Sinomicrobium weinanense TaxID=2842200 RepID=A0A926JTH7_9FLAO|nr:undecaprenyl-phosphate glucose phosphotransferase [Sinomicrobium weinanense]MBC9796911.1 undecaprenyl-phosphate glucose phosphotransferase [Sinomicrobium weinanense]MBU3124219.1 undecaprenyl-phosphate glucose phosphotransferase [Sinomicrobium weinanense]